MPDCCGADSPVGASSKARSRLNPRGVGPVTSSVSLVNRTPFPFSVTGLVKARLALVWLQRLLWAHCAVQARQVTVPVAVARAAVQFDQCRCVATSPSSAQVRIMLVGRTTAAPWPHISTFGVTAELAAAEAALAATGTDTARPTASAARTISARRMRLSMRHFAIILTRHLLSFFWDRGSSA